MELAQDKINLIEKIIKTNKKYANNEDLYDDFFNETCRRSLRIVEAISSDTTLEAYLRKIATTSILNVLKNEGRLRRTRSGYQQNNTISLDDIVDYSKVEISYPSVHIQNTPENLAVEKDILQKIIDSVCAIDKENPDKKYLELYRLRYEKYLTQKEIASELNLSQSEISKRLFRLMETVKQAFNQD